MKISEMTTDQFVDFSIHESEYVANIMEDKEVSSIIDDFEAVKNENWIVAVGKMARRIGPIALKNHKNDVFEIIAGLTCKTAEEVKKQNWRTTMQEAYESWDGELLAFFKSFGNSGSQK